MKQQRDSQGKGSLPQKLSRPYGQRIYLPPPDDPEITEAPDTLLNVNIEKPSKKEIKRTTKEQRNGKLSGQDDIPAKVLKAYIITSTDAVRNRSMRKFGNKNPSLSTGRKVIW